MTEFYNIVRSEQDTIKSPDFNTLFHQTTDKFEQASKQQSLVSSKDPFQLTEEYLISNSINIKFNGINKFALDLVIKDHASLPAVEKNLIRNLAKKEDVHGVYYLMGVLYKYYSKDYLIGIIDWVNKFSGQKQFREEVLFRPKDSQLVDLVHFSEKEVALFYRFFTLISIETFETIGSRFNALFKPPQQQQYQEPLIDPHQFTHELYMGYVIEYPSPISSPLSTVSNINFEYSQQQQQQQQVFNNSLTVEVINDNSNNYFNLQDNYSSSPSSASSSVQSTPTMLSTNLVQSSPPSSPSYSQIAPSTPGPLFLSTTNDYYSNSSTSLSDFPNFQVEPITNNNINNCQLSTDLSTLSTLSTLSIPSIPIITSSINTTTTTTTTTTSSDLFSSQFSSHVQPKKSRASNINIYSNGKSKRVNKTNSIPKAIIPPQFRKRLLEFGFLDQELDRPSHLAIANYIYGDNGISSMVNTMLHPIPNEVSTGRIVRNGLLVLVKDVDLYPKVTAVASLLSKDHSTEHFELKKNNFNCIEPGVYHFEFSIKRNEKNEKLVAIKLELYSNNVLIDTITTPFIRFRNTPSEFSHPNENTLLRHQPYQPINQILPFHIDPNDYVAKSFIGVTNFFKKGIKATEIPSQNGDIENIQKPGKALIIQFKNLINNEVTRVYQDFTKVKAEDEWKFGHDGSGNIINFIYSNVIEFKCIIQKGTYDITFLYDNVTREILPQIKSYIIQ